MLVLGSYLQGFFVTSFIATASYDGPGLVSMGFDQATYSFHDERVTRTWYVAILSVAVAFLQASNFAAIRGGGGRGGNNLSDKTTKSE